MSTMTLTPPITIVVALDGPVVRGDLPAFCERIRGLLQDSGADVVLCDLRAVAAEMCAVDALARLQLTAHRLGRRVELRHVSPALQELLEVAGLAGVLGLQPGGQAEEREQPLGVEEEGELADPAG